MSVYIKRANRLSMENRCLVKYIEIKSIQGNDPDFNIDKFVIHSETISHATYEEMHTKIFECADLPAIYRCMEPLALHHEVLWSRGISNSTGMYMRDGTERDQLHHAIEEQEYSVLWNGSATNTPLPIFVDVEKRAVRAQMDNREPAEVSLVTV